MTRSILSYKCRACGAVADKVSVPGSPVMILAYIVTGTKPESDISQPGLLDVHGCADGRIGVADLVSAREVQ